MIFDQFFSIHKQNAILIEEIQEYRSCNPFISIGKAMILGDEIEKIRCFFLKTRIDFFPRKSLINITDAAFERIIFFQAEKIRCCSKAHAVNHLSALFVSQTVCGGIPLWTLQRLMIIRIQKIQRRTVSFHNRKYLFCIQRVFGSLQQFNYIAEIIQPLLINRISLQNILLQYVVCPTSEFYAAL